ncbi:MAG: hypothetical protein A3J09_00230 [Candidatus Zambryskibacteria bacterium RIFCSPLOWO2_02_FULL_51_21]|uniref:Glutaredoxin domain-containing protein n=1 Tax=Candidatus Zambryskibacteria bacterium RIFCSPHIGHO2_02_FULL_43_37 TaxID=1802749 RepID=A0A1G2THX3_9BACT|nr:MAG: hypothetical protein A2723_00230 [Candidatus Zambryskibacteria bacterium RIFCSPHIGHO2_01_FULL_52_18]OHA96886.1 MAG: hypothetical protein A3D49_02130 [Candidatus Zambryskibacteria bacterium RIFCSPHIGHO2_02_FULL_43_37]OHB07057.1 MAG: hypothetical protein A2944_02225 [Candidatus Zambryskibacteria bacterium RIFCSPLOWO2_01_FULL_52_12]OHB10998.1 MAG: hypothetical protein A3J09_00230 [Candidatus Zambryskibacteria bacterium RIFCSPLOWO2_02_FULL_51_21]
MKNKKVEIYSTPTCHFCHMAKEFFQSHGVEYADYNVAADTEKRREMMEKSGQLGVPVIIIDGKDLVIGFNEPVITKVLGL